MNWDKIIADNMCRISPDGVLIHPGLPSGWGMFVWASMAMIVAWGIYTPTTAKVSDPYQAKSQWPLGTLPGFGRIAHYLTGSPYLITALKFITVALFLIVIWAGLAGTPLSERNLATVLTWNLWWSGVIVSVFFMGSAWCAICPWDALASWFVKRRLWRRTDAETSIGLRVPKTLRSVWPALAAFVVLTWLELGVGITGAPRATAILALFMLIMATVSMAIFERKAFCRFACPVGRTIGFYSQLAPVELRPQKLDICATCTSLECYHGSDDVDPCPTHQVMGRMTQNTFCTSCGNCARSCPHENVGWRLRPPSHEALEGARPHWDEAWFMVTLLALTGFHGLTMMEFWEGWIRQLARTLGDSGQLLWSFSIGMIVATIIPIGLYLAVIWLTHFFNRSKVSFTDLFTRLAFVALPLAFAYHLAHNLAHLLREGIGAGAVFANPLGLGELPLSLEQRHARMSEMALAPTTLAALQALLMALGFFIAVLVIRRRGAGLFKNIRTGENGSALTLAPVYAFAVLITGFHLWLLMQPMIMRV
ncbi:MAG: 4Fe-4S binding protein [bacterium]|nr:4Fe-4S binding protein [bacterium]